MAVSRQISDDGSKLTIKISGRFDFSAHKDFRESYEEVGEKPEQFCVDLSSTEYLDSSALGMLLLLRDHAGGDAARVKIINCNPDVLKILRISNFEQLFTIH